MWSPGKNFALPLVALVTLTLASESSAAIPPKYEAWRNGPVQWIMTPEEQRAWRGLKDENEAIRFVDLLWARRDPTTGTLRNEFKDEFDSRVQLTDQRFGEARKRGSMSDRGRVYIVLGTPTNAGIEGALNTRQIGGGSSDFDPTGGRQMGARTSWIWEHRDAIKWGMPKIEVVFIEKMGATPTVNLDPQRPDFFRASTAANRKALVNRDLTEAPEWALRGGIDPITMMIVPQKAATGGSTTASTESSSSQAPSMPTTAAPMKSSQPAAAAVTLNSSGSSRLTLVREIASIATETKTNPFTTLVPVSVFRAQDELGWVAQYCYGTLEPPTVKFTVRITGNAAGRNIDLSADEEELIPDAIKSNPGCSLLRAAIPLAGMAAGQYQLEVSIVDPASGKRDVLKKEFRIE